MNKSLNRLIFEGKRRFMQALLRVLPLLAAFVLFSYGASASGFVRVAEQHFVKDGKPCFFLGADLWYAPSLACDEAGGGRERLVRELNRLDSLGVGLVSFPVRALADSLQPLPLVRTLEGIDFVLKELALRDMLAVVDLPWEWGGGRPFVARADSLLNHRNTLTGRRYADETTIMAWHVGPQTMPQSAAAGTTAAAATMQQVLALKKLDANHLVMAGGAGLKAYGDDAAAYARLANSPMVDCLSLQLCPAEWNWVARSRVAEDLSFAYLQSNEYIEKHSRLAFKSGKPLVVTAFSYPRKGFFATPGTRVDSRDAYFGYVVSQLLAGSRGEGAVGGAFFRGWGGEAVPEATGKASPVSLLAEKPGEERGTFSVYASDASTLTVIAEACRQLQP